MKKLALLLVLALLSVCFLSVANCAYGNTVNDDNTGSNGGSDNTGGTGTGIGNGGNNPSNPVPKRFVMRNLRYTYGREWPYRVAYRKENVEIANETSEDSGIKGPIAVDV